MGTVLAATAGAVVYGVAPLAAQAETITVSPTGSVLVTYNGNGHGHGMSQYGAQGAALAGRNFYGITAFYYPGTKPVKLAPSSIRVKLSGYGTTLTISPSVNLVVTGVSWRIGYIGFKWWRLIANAGSGIDLQYLKSAAGSTWTTYRTNLPDGAQFRRTDGGVLRIWSPDNSSNDYYGTLIAHRNAATGASAGLYQVDQLGLEQYTAGVVPREMPASWQPNALGAQAIAARTYARYEVEHSTNPNYDICDSSMCQVYGGHTGYDSSGNVLYTDDPAPVTATAGLIRTYNGATIFSQFSASDGGWTTYGGQPYLPAQADPYDNAASGDPYLGATKLVKVSALESYFGIPSVTKIAITTRDGHGAWGGRVLAGTIYGTNAAHAAVSKAFTGFDMQYALGLGTTWFTLAPHA